MTNDVKEMGEVVGELQTPQQRIREFFSLDAALDFCKFAQPSELHIKVFVQGHARLTYINNEGQL